MLHPEKQVNKNDAKEFEAIDCNNCIVAMLSINHTSYPTYQLVKEEVGDQKLNWLILEQLATEFYA